MKISRINEEYKNDCILDSVIYSKRDAWLRKLVLFHLLCVQVEYNTTPKIYMKNI